MNTTVENDDPTNLPVDTLVGWLIASAHREEDGTITLNLVQDTRYGTPSRNVHLWGFAEQSVKRVAIEDIT